MTILCGGDIYNDKTTDFFLKGVGPDVLGHRSIVTTENVWYPVGN